MENVNLNKFFLLYLLLPFFISSEDLKIADDFKEGDILSADNFNQIFDIVEKINRTVKDEDLIGIWNCSSINSGSGSADTSGWTKDHYVIHLANR